MVRFKGGAVATLLLSTALTVEALKSPCDGTLEDQLRDFAEAAASGRDPESTGEEGLRALRLARAPADEIRAARKTVEDHVDRKPG